MPTRKLRQSAGRLIAVGSIVALAAGLGVPTASADKVGSLQAQARELEARIQALGIHEDALAQRYDAALIALQHSRQALAKAKQEEAQASRSVTKAKRTLMQEAIAAYEQSGTSTISGASSSVKKADKALLSAEYENNEASTQTDALGQYKLATVQDQAAENALRAQEDAQRQSVQSLASDKQAVLEAENSLAQVMRRDKGQIAVLVARQQAAEQAAALRLERQKLAEQKATQEAAAKAAAAAASTTTTSTATTQRRNASPTTGAPTTGAPTTAAPTTAAPTTAAPTTAAPITAPPTTAPPTTKPPQGPPTTEPPTNPPPSGVGPTAVYWAKKELGVPYVWGGASPSGFDCSGLVMWAYAHAGVSLPHNATIQYADTTHISMSQLEPGDLVFPSGLFHVAMYIGGGQIIQAPYTGADVQIVPLSSFFQLASRVQ